MKIASCYLTLEERYILRCGFHLSSPLLFSLKMTLSGAILQNRREQIDRAKNSQEKRKIDDDLSQNMNIKKTKNRMINFIFFEERE
jgi:hypothetical protein